MNRDGTVTEIVKFKTKECYTDEALIKVVDTLHKNFLTKQEGYIDTEIIKEKEALSWMMIIHWESMDLANEVGKVFTQSPETEEYRDALVAVNLLFTHQLETWKLA